MRYPGPRYGSFHVVADTLMLMQYQEQMKISAKSFTSLHTLILGENTPLSPDVVCETISPLKRLVVLSFACAKHEDIDAPYAPSALTTLKDLRIRLGIKSASTFPKLLEPFIRCIAGRSRLERLDIKSSTNQELVVGTHAREFISHILSAHSSSLLKLKIPMVHPSTSHLQQILTDCKHLETLWMGVSRELMMQIPTLLPLSSSLRTLKIYFWNNLLYENAENLLYQNGCSIRKLKTCSVFPHGHVATTSWEVSWTYDASKGRPARDITRGGGSRNQSDYESMSYRGRKYRALLGWASIRGGLSAGVGRGRGTRWQDMAKWISQYAPKDLPIEDESWMKGNRFAALTNTTPDDGKILEWPEADDLSKHLH
ncbi:hypothetical protein CPB86DRAFT_816560 [Serendipita vermifera]|nr:hypothetical protein CPB86DRAFT_816560 [Serendipita vermifera]